MMTFTIGLITSKLTKIVHCNDYKRKLYDKGNRIKQIIDSGESWGTNRLVKIWKKNGEVFEFEE